MKRQRGYYRQRRGCGFGGARLLIALVIAGVALVTYYTQTSVNPVTGEKQHVAMSVDQEIALGLQAAPEMAREFGGVSRDARADAIVDSIGEELVTASRAGKSPYKGHFEFHVLADRDTINAFALPGGQIFITEALLSKLKTRGQIAGVLGHEIGHVVGRHSAEQLAKAQLSQGLAGAAVIATYDPDDPSSRNSAAVAAAIAGLVNMKYGREHELESDSFGVEFMSSAGYDPRAMIEVMNVLKSAGGGRQPEFFSTHPNPENRIARIEEAIKRRFPNGVPENLKD